MGDSEGPKEPPLDRSRNLCACLYLNNRNSALKIHPYYKFNATNYTIEAEWHLEPVNVTVDWGKNLREAFASGAVSQFLPLGEKAASGRGQKSERQSSSPEGRSKECRTQKGGLQRTAEEVRDLKCSDLFQFNWVTC